MSAPDPKYLVEISAEKLNNKACIRTENLRKLSDFIFVIQRRDYET
jgi:hypothetical protein